LTTILHVCVAWRALIEALPIKGGLQTVNLCGYRKLLWVKAVYEGVGVARMRASGAFGHGVL